MEITGYMGTYRMMKLGADGKAHPVIVGDIITDFRGDVYTVTGGYPPTCASSCGSVYTTSDGMQGYYYVSNFGICWVKV